MALRIRRGTSVQRTGITPVSGELIFDTTQNKLYVGNGSTAGGVEVVAGQIGGNLGSNINLNNFDITGAGNINITGTITASGTITGNGNLVLGDGNDDNVSFNADINSNIVPNTGSLTVGTSSKPWQTVFTAALENTSGITSNSNLTVNGLVTVGNNLVPNATRTKDLGTTALRWRNVNAETLSLENIQITQNNITTVDSNSDINVAPSGSGRVLLGPTKIRSYADFGYENNIVIRASNAGIFYNWDQTTEFFTCISNAFETSYTQVAGTTQETFTVAVVDTSIYAGFRAEFNVRNSQGSETFSISGNFYSGTVQISSKQNSHIHSSGITIIDSVSVSPGSGSLVNIRFTTTTNVNAAVITKVKAYATLFTV